MNSQISQSFSGFLAKDALLIPGLDQFLPLGDALYIHPISGVVTSSLSMSDIDVANYWSNTIFESNDIEDYSAVRPFARARLNYVALTARDYLESINCIPKSICDFATGQCILPPIYSDLFPKSTICVTEASLSLSQNAQNLGYLAHNLYLGRGEVSSINVDFASLCWTLCNCINPLSVLQEVSNSILPGGHLIIAESSRIMVPFKKSLSDMISKVHPADVHPYYFSANSLSLLGMLTGLKPVLFNRFYDSDVLTIIFQKPKESFNINDLDISTDSRPELLDFFAKYVEYSQYFDTQKLSQANRA